MTPTSTLVTVTYNNAAQLTRYWRTFDPAWAQWIVVDNASRDGSADVARSFGATVIQSRVNLGFSAANNLARTTAEGDVLIFCNPDLQVDRRGIEVLGETALGKDAIVAPQLIHPDGSLQENGRSTPYPIRKFAHMVGRPRRSAERYLRLAERGELTQVAWCMGAAIAVPSSAMDRIGWWDERFFIYYEDADLSLRALQSGIPTYVSGDVRWVHGWARETKGGFKLPAWKNELRSATRFYLKHPYTIFPVGPRARTLKRIDQGRMG